MPSNTAWDRLADATQPQAVAGGLSIVTLGHVHAEELTALTPHFQKLEQLVLEIPPRDALAQHRAELNRAIDAATNDWILILREREIVDDALAKEIAGAINDGKARGFRVRSIPFYCGQPLRIGEEGEVRLFHRRYYMRYANKGEWQQLMIQGTVVRLSNILRSDSFPSVEAHREQLARSGVRHSSLRRLLLFIRYAAGARTLDRNTLRYLWTESAFDQR